MNTEDREKLLIEQTCTLLAGRLGNPDTKILPADCIKQHFENTYKALAAELNKQYISQYAK